MAQEIFPIDDDLPEADRRVLNVIRKTLLDYEPENKGLFLTRFYEQVPAQETFNAELLTLARASKSWGREVLEWVANKVNAPK